MNHETTTMIPPSPNWYTDNIIDTTENQNDVYTAFGANTSILIYNVSTLQCVHHLKGHKDKITSVKFIPPALNETHLYLVSTSLDGLVKLWDVMNGSLIKSYRIENV